MLSELSSFTKSCLHHEQDYFNAKADKGKVNANILFEDFADALWAIAEVCTFGAQKYSRSSWRSVPNAVQRYADAKSRHLLKQYMKTVSDNELDDESTYTHLAHEAWGALAKLQLYLEEKNKPNG